MTRTEVLEHRLNGIAHVLRDSPDGLALLGLGSVGIETSRLDAWSDLDFFAVVRPGTKARWLSDPSWLSAPAPVSYLFRNTVDGYKLLWDDGVFGEMAVFEPQELANIPYAEGRLIWAHPDFDASLRVPRNPGIPARHLPSVEWSLGELVTCLYVGLCRYHRGERLSAWRFIQNYCLERFFEVIQSTSEPRPGLRDPYNIERRFEQLYPEAAPWLTRFETGMQALPVSALAFLEWAGTVQAVNPALKAEIERLASL